MKTVSSLAWSFLPQARPGREAKWLQLIQVNEVLSLRYGGYDNDDIDGKG